MTSPDVHEDFPAGTSYIVYPGKDGALPSIRLFVFHDALQDIAAMRLLEGAIGHDGVVELMESVNKQKIDWRICPGTDEQFLAIREAVNREIAKRLCD